MHPHLNTVIETPEETDAFMEASDPKYVGRDWTRVTSIWPAATS